jgi:hypothetical protein
MHAQCTAARDDAVQLSAWRGASLSDDDDDDVAADVSSDDTSDTAVTPTTTAATAAASSSERAQAVRTLLTDMQGGALHGSANEDQVLCIMSTSDIYSEQSLAHNTSYAAWHVRSCYASAFNDCIGKHNTAVHSTLLYTALTL